jgi:hypothetical protein
MGENYLPKVRELYEAQPSRPRHKVERSTPQRSGFLLPDFCRQAT